MKTIFSKAFGPFIFFVFFIYIGFSQTDSLQREMLKKQVEEQSGIIDNLHEKVEGLEEFKETLMLWVKILGIPIAGLSLYTIYLAFFGIKNKADQIVEKVAEEKISAIAPGILRAKLEEHPVMKEYKKIQNLKAKPILIISANGKNADFNDFLSKRGFTSIQNAKIDSLRDINKDDFFLILFNNQDIGMSQKKMNEVVNKYGNSLHYFYFQGEKGDRWDNQDVKMVGFATTLERLENNLIDALNR